MNQRQMFALGFFVVLLILLYQIAIIFRPFLLPVLWAVILAHMTFPLHRRLTALLGQRKGFSAAILTVAIIGLVVVPLVIFIVQLIEEAGRAYVLAKTWIDGGGLKTAPGQLSQLPIIGGYVQPILGRLVLSQGDLETSLLHNIQALSGFFVEQLTGLATNLFLLIMNFLVMPIYFLSGALFPLNNLPAGLRIATRINPLTYGIDGLRGAFIGTSHFSTATSVGVMSVVAVVFLALGARSFAKIQI